MKYTRFEMHKINWNPKTRLIIYFVIVLPIFALMAGSILSKYIIVPYAQTGFDYAEGTENTQTSSLVENKQFKLYYLQAGVFTKKDNAEILKSGLSISGINSFIVEDKNLFRIIVETGINKESLQNIRDKLLRLGYECLISEKNYSIYGLGDNKEQKLCQNYFGSVLNMITLQIEINCSNSKIVSNSIEQIKKDFINLKAEYDDYRAQSTLGNTDSFKKANDEFNINISNYIDFLSSGKIDLAKQCLANEIIIFDSMFSNIKSLYSGKSI